MLRRLAVCVLALGLLAAPATAAQEDDEARVVASCAGGGSAELRLKADDGELGVRFRVSRARVGLWRLVLVHERRVAWRGTLQSRPSRRSFELRRALPDLAGSDTVTATAWGPRGAACRATATVAGR